MGIHVSNYAITQVFHPDFTVQGGSNDLKGNETSTAEMPLVGLVVRQHVVFGMRLSSQSTTSQTPCTSKPVCPLACLHKPRPCPPLPPYDPTVFPLHRSTPRPLYSTTITPPVPFLRRLHSPKRLLDHPIWLRLQL